MRISFTEEDLTSFIDCVHRLRTNS